MKKGINPSSENRLPNLWKLSQNLVKQGLEDGDIKKIELFLKIIDNEFTNNLKN